MWLAIEIIAIITECFLALNFNSGYFKMKDNKYVHWKIIGGTVILSLWDYLSTMIIKNEFFAMSGFALIVLDFRHYF